MELRSHAASLTLAEEFAIARGSRTSQEVVRVELEHDGIVGLGESAPIYYRGETVDSALRFLREQAPPLMGADPLALEQIERRLDGLPGEAAAKAALDAALHDWVGKRLGQPTWRLLGLDRAGPPTSYTIGIDTLAGTRDRARRATGYRALKVKVGGQEDLARLEAVREESPVPLRVDANEAWTLESARELMPALVELGVELVEQPFPAADRESLVGLRELPLRAAVVLDESCHDLRDVAAAVGVADGINVKLAKSGGVREALRMIHAARALGLRTMLGCMIESELGIAPAAQIASLVDWVDLDGHLLLAERPFEGLELSDGVLLAPDAPGLGVRAA